MIRKGTKIEIVDNTGGLEGECIEIYGRKVGKIGDRILLAIKKSSSSSVKELSLVGRKIGGVIVMTSSIGGINGAVLVKEVKEGEVELLGSVIKIPVMKELERVKGVSKILAAAEEEI